MEEARRAAIGKLVDAVAALSTHADATGFMAASAPARRS